MTILQITNRRVLKSAVSTSDSESCLIALLAEYSHYNSAAPCTMSGRYLGPVTSTLKRFKKSSREREVLFDIHVTAWVF